VTGLISNVDGLMGGFKDAVLHQREVLEQVKGKIKNVAEVLNEVGSLIDSMGTTVSEANDVAKSVENEANLLREGVVRTENLVASYTIEDLSMTSLAAKK
jgi:methyl-accepting chemotaxis protein